LLAWMGCGSEGGDDGSGTPSLETIHASQSFDVGGLVAANGALDVYAGRSVASLGCLTYTIGGPQPTPVQQVTEDGSFELFAFATDTQIIGTDRTLRCAIERSASEPRIFRLIEDGTVVLSALGPFLLRGDLSNAPVPGSLDESQLLERRLAYSLAGSQIFEGPLARDRVLATTTVDDLQLASGPRKLLFGALVEARCGANGLIDSSNWNTND